MTSKRAEEEAEKNRRKLLEVEAAATVLLFRSTKSAVAAGLASQLSPRRIAAKMEADFTNAVVEARRKSRRGGLTRLRLEAQSLGLQIKTTVSKILDARDLKRAKDAASSLARRWLRLANEASPSEALDATRGTVRRIAVTESSDAFSAGRKEAVKVIGKELVRVWDAKLDACPRCREADGQIVGIRESFRLGEPGSVHPFCRCSWTLATLEETR